MGINEKEIYTHTRKTELPINRWHLQGVREGCYRRGAEHFRHCALPESNHEKASKKTGGRGGSTPSSVGCVACVLVAFRAILYSRTFSRMPRAIA